MNLVLLVLLVSLSCAHGNTTRTAYTSSNKKPITLHVSACPKSGDCDESAIQKIADYFCREKDFDDHQTFKLRKITSADAKATKLHTCDLKENANDNTKSHCDWSDIMMEDEKKADAEQATQIYSEIACHRQTLDSNSRVQTFKLP